jgi:hypothetical protein
MHPDELARLVDRELKRLPTPRAPETLLTRVMTAVQQRPSRTGAVGWWYRWPIAVRALSAAASVAVLAGLWWFWPAMQAQLAGALAGTTAARFGVVLDVFRQAAAISTALDALWRTVLQPLSSVLLPLVLLMWAACAALGAALGRVALGGATPS